MKLLIVAATKEEILSSIPLLQTKNIPFLITGVGMTATAFALGKYLAQNPTDLVINVGIAGALDKEIKIGSLVNIETDYFAELGAENDLEFITIDALGFGQSKYTTIKQKYTTLALPIYEAITVNKVHGNNDSISKIKSIFPNAAIESMEGAAVFYACQAENIPALQVRAISNYVEKRDKSTWNIPLAIKNLNIWLQETVMSLKSI